MTASRTASKGLGFAWAVVAYLYWHITGMPPQLNHLLHALGCGFVALSVWHATGKGAE